MIINAKLDENKYIQSYSTTDAIFENNVEITMPSEYVKTVMEKGTFYGDNGTVIEMDIPVEVLTSEFTSNYDCFKYGGGVLILDEQKVKEKEEKKKEEEINSIKAQIVELTKTKDIYIQNEWDTTDLDKQIADLNKKLKGIVEPL